MPKLPHIQLYTGDWLKEPSLRLVSLAAKGLWIDLLCHMNESPERGVLVNHRGSAYNRSEIAKLLGLTADTINPLLDELEGQDVYSINEKGAIFSRRLVRDEEDRKQREENGKKGGRPSTKGGSEPPPSGYNYENQKLTEPITEHKTKGEPNHEPNTDNDIGYDIGSSFEKKKAKNLAPAATEKPYLVASNRHAVAELADWSKPDIHERAKALAAEMHGKHPVHTDLIKAELAIQQRLLNAKKPETEYSAIRDSHAANVPEWQSKLERNPDAYVPQLHTFISGAMDRQKVKHRSSGALAHDYFEVPTLL